MKLRIKYYDPKDQLTSLIERLIKILKFENSSTFHLLKKVTSGKSAIIQLDNCKLKIKGENGDSYTITVTKEIETNIVNFKTQSSTLRKILSGQCTIDKAIADQEIFICAPFEDVMDMHKLTMSLLADAALSSHLRNLWDEFVISWDENSKPLIFASYELQQPSFDKHIQHIPSIVLLIGLPSTE